MIDGTIQGRSIRLLMRDGAPCPMRRRSTLGPDTQVEPAAPRFEDGFIELLGGGPTGTSQLAEQLSRRSRRASARRSRPTG